MDLYVETENIANLCQRHSMKLHLLSDKYSVLVYGRKRYHNNNSLALKSLIKFCCSSSKTICGVWLVDIVVEVILGFVAGMMAGSDNQHPSIFPICVDILTHFFFMYQTPQGPGQMTSLYWQTFK